MSVARSRDLELFTTMIQNGVKAEIEKILEEEITKAQAVVEDRVRKSVDGIALNIMRHYEVSSFGETITIQVKKDI